LRAVGAEVHLAEPAETRVLRGPKRRPKTDRADAKHLRELLQQGRLPESWIPPEQILELRSLVRLRHSLVEQRTAWLQRIHAQLFHHGRRARPDLLVRERRAWVEDLELPHAARPQIEVALSLIDRVNAELVPLDRELRQIANSWPGAKALQAHYGVGPLTAVAFLAELGDARRFTSSGKAVRYAGSTSPSRNRTHSALRAGSPDKGLPTLRWAAFEAAQSAHKPNSPDHDYCLQAADRLGGNRACLALARKLLQRATIRCANSARRHSSPHETAGGHCARRAPNSDDDLRPAPRLLLPPRQRPGRSRKTERPQHRPRDHPINTIMSPAPKRPWTELSLGVRARSTRADVGPTRTPHPTASNSSRSTRTLRLTRGPKSDKQHRAWRLSRGCCLGRRLSHRRLWRSRSW
jgi:transposase